MITDINKLQQDTRSSMIKEGRQWKDTARTVHTMRLILRSTRLLDC